MSNIQRIFWIVLSFVLSVPFAFAMGQATFPAVGWVVLAACWIASAYGAKVTWPFGDSIGAICLAIPTVMGAFSSVVLFLHYAP